MESVSDACRMVFEQYPLQAGLYVGFSGGLDSTVLLHGLVRAAAARTAAPKIVAVHLDHGLAPDSGRWRVHCETAAAGLGVEFVTETLALEAGANLEARARAARYSTFERLLSQGGVLALAHHLGDQNESILLHLLQGRGLFGMPGYRELGRGALVRPLLGIPRSRLEDYARQEQLSWLEDPSNQDQTLDRNFLRHQILPPLNARFVELDRRLQRVVSHVRDAERTLIEVLDLRRNPLPLEVLDGRSNHAAVSILRHWLIAQNAAAVSDVALTDFLTQLGAASDRQPRLAIPAGSLARHRRQLYLVRPGPELEPSYPMSVPGSLVLPHGVVQLSESASTASSPVTVVGPVRVAFLTGLEADSSLRVAGHLREARSIMREAGLPPWERDQQPLLLDNLGLLAVAGLAVRDPVAESRNRLLHLCWEPGTTGVGGSEVGAGVAAADQVR